MAGQGRALDARSSDPGTRSAREALWLVPGAEGVLCHGALRKLPTPPTAQRTEAGNGGSSTGDF